MDTPDKTIKTTNIFPKYSLKEYGPMFDITDSLPPPKYNSQTPIKNQNYDKEIINRNLDRINGKILSLNSIPKYNGINQLDNSIMEASQLHPAMNSTIQSKIWIEDPTVLFQTLDIMPDANMTNAERLNAMTRVIIIITAIMFILKFPVWWLFLGLGLIVVIIIWYIIKGREQVYLRQQREYLRKPRRRIITPLNKIISPANIYESDINNQRLNIISIP